MIWHVLNIVMMTTFIGFVFRIYDMYMTPRALQELRQAYVHMCTREKSQIDLEHVEILLGRAEVHETTRTQLMLWTAAVAIVMPFVSVLVSTMVPRGTAGVSIMWFLTFTGLIVMFKQKIPEFRIKDLFEF